MPSVEIDIYRARDLAARKYSKYQIAKGYEYDGLYIFIPQEKDAGMISMQIVQPIAFNKKTHEIRGFNPLTADREKLLAAQKNAVVFSTK